MFRFKYWLAAVVTILGACWGVLAQDPTPDEKDPSIWMKQKLTYSSRILEGLAKGDMDLVNQNATAMRGLNKVEYFVRREPANYRTQLNVFQFSVDELIRTSRENNLDGATLAFTQMTISCVNCHKQIRKT